MSEMLKLLVFETRSIPRGYQSLHRIVELGLECLEFTPHAEGVRILFKISQNISESEFQKSLMNYLGQDESCEIVEINQSIMKALLSQTGTALQKNFLVVEARQFAQLLRLAMQLEQIGARAIEIRSLRSNNQKNYGVFTLESDEGAKSLLKNFEHAVIPAGSKSLQEFLGFSL